MSNGIIHHRNNTTSEYTQRKNQKVRREISQTTEIILSKATRRSGVPFLELMVILELFFYVGRREESDWTERGVPIN